MPTPRKANLTPLQAEKEKSERRISACKAKCDAELHTAMELVQAQARRLQMRELEAEVLKMHEEKQASEVHKARKVLGSLGSTHRPKKTSAQGTSPSACFPTKNRHM